MTDVFQRMAEEYRAKGNWSGFMEIRRNIDKDRGPSALEEVPLTVPDAEYRALVRQTYTWSHGIWENRVAWLRIFNGAQRDLGSFTAAADELKLAKMPDPLVIYRGCCEHNQQGFSWTLDRQRAERFAAFSQEHSKAIQRIIISGKIVHARISAYVTIRNEEEIVALPEHVTQQQLDDITHLPFMTESMIKKLGKDSK